MTDETPLLSEIVALRFRVAALEAEVARLRELAMRLMDQLAICGAMIAPLDQ